MTTPDDTANGWERWRGEVTAKLDALLDGREDMRREVHETRCDVEQLRLDHQATKGLVKRSIIIGIGAWAAIAAVASWIVMHIAGGQP